MADFEERLGAVMRFVEQRSAMLDANARRHHFTPESAREANRIRYEGVERKPATATIRVEADIVDIIKAWDRSVRVAEVSKAIRAAAMVEEVRREALCGEKS